jgi:uncharacterized protein (DUF302 family)
LPDAKAFYLFLPCSRYARDSRNKVQMSFEDAVKRVETLSEEGGFTILLTKGMHDMFKKKLGINDYPR